MDMMGEKDELRGKGECKVRERWGAGDYGRVSEVRDGGEGREGETG